MIHIPAIPSMSKYLVAILCLCASATFGAVRDSPGGDLRGSPEAAALQRDFPFLAKLLTADRTWEQEPAELARTIFERPPRIAQGSPAYPLRFQDQRALGGISWGEAVLRRDSDWYASAEARTAADILLLYQSPHGAWPKNTDLFKSIPPDELASVHLGDKANTIDNGATIRPMRFLAKMVQAKGETKYKESFRRGLDYLFEAQYPNGGWPQFYPLRKGYYSRITFNDGAMINVMTLLRDVSTGLPPYNFVEQERRDKAATALTKGIECILKTQIKQDGRLTVWCAQHDEKTLEPAWARAYEPPSLSGGESVGIVRFLMSIEEPTPEIVAAIEGAVAWFRSVAMKGVRIEAIRRDDGRTERRLVADPAAPPLWARFYELGTNRALYLDRDSVFRYDFAEISYERRSGYSYHGTGPAELLARDYPRWRQKRNLP